MAEKSEAEKAFTLPSPDLSDVKYGPHERNVLDLWKAKRDKPTPLVVCIHGGGFRGGNKNTYMQEKAAILVNLCLEAGISVAAINYRLSGQAIAPAAMLDGARAVQFLRYKAAEWNLDPEKFAATGGSAGGGISLWLGFHDDLANPEANDPVERESTRLSSMGVVATQTSYDLLFIRELFPGNEAWEHPALLQFYGITQEEIDSPRARKLYNEVSALPYVSADDPPVFMFYPQPNVPLAPDAGPNVAIHHPKFGFVLKEKLDALGIECIVRCQDDYEGDPREQYYREMLEFFQRHFGCA
jgi:acetyl esterase/lipase